MSTPELPPIPPEFREWWDHGGDNDATLLAIIRSYGESCFRAGRLAGLEEAAEEAESFRSNDKAVNLTAHEIVTGEVAESIADAIRSLKEKQG
jgi:hypothetical protein